jgi:hypothetical protein
MKRLLPRLVSLAFFCCLSGIGAESKYSPGPAPMRPLPAASTRPLSDGPQRFADASKGDDANDGTAAKPWRTLGFAAARLKPGDTLLLRGGIYREHPTLTCAGTSEKAITIRAHPGELVVLDGGIAEFYESPETAWEPFVGGADGEYRSTRAYPKKGGAGADNEAETTLLGSFADTMVPLQGCHVMADLRSSNPFWFGAGEKMDINKSIYCGPSICFDDATQRIHARFAPTDLVGLGNDNYRGETDPRKLRLVIATLEAGPVLKLRGARCLRLQDMVVRGAREATVVVEDCSSIALEGVTSYGGAAAVRVQGTRGLRMASCALRGIAGPWTFRSSLKYRSIEARIFAASSWTPLGRDNEDFEIANCEFTDSVDGVFIGSVRGVNFHHNLLENISDDGIFLTSGTAPDGTTHGGNVHLWQNRIARCLTVFAFGVGHGRQKMLATGRQTGAGIWAHNNVIDERKWVPYFPPHSSGEPQDLTFKGRMCGDHGSPAWEPLAFYNNTILEGAAPFRAAYLDGLGHAISPGAPRRLLNNIVALAAGVPGTVFQEKEPDLIADSNLHWGYAPGVEMSADDFLRKLRGAKTAVASVKQYAPGWAAHDLYADPRFVKYNLDPNATVDVRLQKESPAIGAGLSIPAEWPAPLAGAKGRDLGAIPASVEAWRVGVGGRLDISGQPQEPLAALAHLSLKLPDPGPAPNATAKPAALVEGYPAADAPLVRFALRKAGANVEHFDRQWLHTTRLGEFSVVTYVGSLARAKASVSKFTAEDFPRVRAYLENGGTIVLLRATTEMFASAEGEAFLNEVGGGGPRVRTVAAAQLLLPKHPWLAHLDPAAEHPWIAAGQPLRASKGERILGTPEGLTTLCRIPVGKGALVYLGWEISAAMPGGRKASTVEMERAYEDQYRILENAVTSSLHSRPAAK